MTTEFGGTGTGWQPERLKDWHVQMVSAVAVDPGVTNLQLAERFGFDVTHISRIRSSDVFETKLEERRREMRAGSESKLQVASDEAAQATVLVFREIHERLKAGKVADTFLLRAADILVRATGLGDRDKSKPADDGTRDYAAELLELAANAMSVAKRSTNDA
jgi:hypothetical protein